jgi:hypothetical protein
VLALHWLAGAGVDLSYGAVEIATDLNAPVFGGGQHAKRGGAPDLCWRAPSWKCHRFEPIRAGQLKGHPLDIGQARFEEPQRMDDGPLDGATSAGALEAAPAR